MKSVLDFCILEKLNIMTEKLQFNLVLGNYSPEEAATVLPSLINNKINFHELDIFRLNERGEGNSDRSEHRIGELTESRKQVRLLLEQCKKDGLRVSVKGVVEVTIA